MRLLIRRVVGVSMQPVLHDGQIILAYPRQRSYGAGDVVIFSHDGRDKVKRIIGTRVHDDLTEVFVQGDNTSASTDSRDFGWVPVEYIRGKLIWPLQRLLKKH
jgi:hypothetical protein